MTDSAENTLTYIHVKLYIYIRISATVPLACTYVRTYVECAEDFAGFWPLGVVVTIVSRGRQEIIPFFVACFLHGVLYHCVS